jgi:TldD protein
MTSYMDSGNLEGAAVPMAQNPKALQLILWTTTEAAAKAAQERFLKVQTNAQTASARSDDSDDFSSPPASPSKYYEAVNMPSVDEAKWSALLNEYSAMFKGYDFIFSSLVDFTVSSENVYFVNSEGARIKKGRVLIRLSYSLSTRNKDGMEMERNMFYDGFSLDQMPSPAKVKEDILKSIEELKALQNAPVAEPFHGPVILKNRATGVFFHEILGHRLEGHRQKDDDFGQTFTGKVGQQIVSPLISVYDDATMQTFNGVPLRGYYKYDDEGVPSQRVTLIKDGVLENFLMSRSPIKGFPQSNGHGRKAVSRKAVSRMGVTVVEAKETVPFEELRQKLIAEIKKQNKPYGLIIEDISGGFTNTDTYNPQAFKVQPLLVYKVYPDGRPDEIIRGADIVGTPLVSLNKIIAAANDYDIFNGSCGAESGWVPVSAVAPSLLITELEVEKVNKTYESLPILPPPYGDASKQSKKGDK